nr:MAG TPA: hypothetical protein [Caudoviricetes sp.]
MRFSRPRFVCFVVCCCLLLWYVFMLGEFADFARLVAMLAVIAFAIFVCWA